MSTVYSAGSKNNTEVVGAPVSERTETNHDVKTHLDETEETKQLSLPELQRLVLLKQLNYYKKLEEAATNQRDMTNKRRFPINATVAIKVDLDGLTIIDQTLEQSTNV